VLCRVRGVPINTFLEGDAMNRKERPQGIIRVDHRLEGLVNPYERERGDVKEENSSFRSKDMFSETSE